MPETRKVRTCDVVVARLKINAALELRVLAQTFQGGCHVHIREFALTNDNAFVATPKGVNFPAERLELALDAVRELREAGDSEGVVATIPAGNARAIRFAVTKWQGTTKADIRAHFSGKEPGEWVPTRKGTRFNLGLLAELERALEALERELFG